MSHMIGFSCQRKSHKGPSEGKIMVIDVVSQNRLNTIKKSLNLT